MAFKFLLIASLAIATSAVQVQHQNYGQYQLQQVAPVATKVLAPSAPVLVKKYQEEPTAPAHYSFEYSVDDGHTGDVKSQKEVRDGDRVEGYYSLIDADGHKRVVHYTADEHNGFQARVEREEIKGYVAPAPVKVQYATPAPLKVQYAAPSVQYSAPSVQYSAPSVQYAAPTVQYATPSPVKYVAPAPLKYVAPTTAKFVQKVESYTPDVKTVQTFAPLAKVAVPTKLQYASSLPQYTQPQVQYSQPQVQYSQPQVQYSHQPQVQYSHQPQVQYSQPKSQYQSSGVTSVKFESPVANYYY